MSLDKVAAQFIQQPLVVLQGKLSQSKPEAKVTAFCNAVESLANSLVNSFQSLGSLSTHLNRLFVSPTQEFFASMAKALQVIDNGFSSPSLTPAPYFPVFFCPPKIASH